tara:strand:- start:844 stop:1044 length:201 start_codon:yes stop_codon:yes gene_type:complete
MEAKMKTGELYILGIGAGFSLRGVVVIYLRECERYANQHWVVLPDGRQQSVWAGHLKPTGEQDETA